jgi:hypothetical protein
VEARVWIAARPARVWALVSDIELMPALSSELQSVHWLDGATGASVGARFTGRSKHEAMGEWEATPAGAEGRRDRAVAMGADRAGRSGLSLAIDQIPDKEQKIVFVRMREFERNMTATLGQVKKLAEAAGAPVVR